GSAENGLALVVEDVPSPAPVSFLPVFDEPPHDLDVLLRHRPPSISGHVRSANGERGTEPRNDGESGLDALLRLASCSAAPSLRDLGSRPRAEAHGDARFARAGA